MADRTTAIALFDDRAQAQRAIDQLKRVGFSEKEIGVTARDVNPEAKAVNTEKGKDTHATEGAVAGVAAGAGVGALWGLGILAGALPAIGPAIAGGTLAVILSSAAAGAATAGLAGALIGAGIPEDEANYYEGEFRAGRVLVTVRADGRLSEAQGILEQNGGYDMRSGRERAGSGMGTATAAGSGMRADSTAGLEGARTLEAREEELRVRKRPVQTGEAEVRKEVRTERRTVDVPVKKEELVIERHAVGRHAASGPVGEEERVRVPLSEERVDVEKTPVVTERVSVGKRETEEDERVDATIRKENIKVDKRGRTEPRNPPR